MKRFFHWNGRIRRSEFWAYGFGLNVASAILAFLNGYLNGIPFLQLPIEVLIIAFSAYISICLVIQRLHDLNKPGWYYFAFVFAMFVLIFLGEYYIPSIQYVGVLLGVICVTPVYFFKGTDGDNQYGPDPHAITFSAAE